MQVNPNLQAQGTMPSGTGKVEGHDVKAALGGGQELKPPEVNMSVTPLSGRNTEVTTQVLEKSKSLGFGGLFRAVLDRIFNSSTKSWDQARINVAAKNFLKANPQEAEQISREVAENLSSMEPLEGLRVAQAFVGALMECRSKLLETFCPGVIKQIDLLIERGSKEPSCFHQYEIKNALALVSKLAKFLSQGKNFSPSALALCALAQRFPGNEITPDIIALCKNFPEEALALAKRQDCKMTPFTATGDDGGLTLVYMDKGYNPEILDLITPNLFEEGTDRDAAIGNFLTSTEFQSNLVWMDGILRCDMSHITLPKGIEILSNRGSENSEYCREMGKPYDQAEYLKYVLDQFREAYGPDEAIKAFKVFVQNFTGCGNTFGDIAGNILSEMPENFVLATRAMNLLGSFRGQENYVHATQMDKDFGIRLNITVCASKEEEIETFNQPIPQYRIRKDDMLALTVSSHIPAVINDTMDQSRQEGTQTTHYSLMYTFQPNA